MAASIDICLINYFSSILYDNKHNCHASALTELLRSLSQFDVSQHLCRGSLRVLCCPSAW